MTKTKRNHPAILDLAERLYAAEEKLAAEPTDSILQRIVSNLRSDKGRYEYKANGGRSVLLITVGDWERVENGEAVPVAVYGGGYKLVTPEVAAANYAPARVVARQKARARREARARVNAALASGPAAVVALVNEAFEADATAGLARGDLGALADFHKRAKRNAS